MNKYANFIAPRLDDAPQFAAHFDLETDEGAIIKLLSAVDARRLKAPYFKLFLAAYRSQVASLNVWHEVERRGLEPWVSYHPYMDVLSDFPVWKRNCAGWFDAQSSPALIADFIHARDGQKHTVRRRDRVPSVLFVTAMHPGKNEGNSRLMREWLRRFKGAGYRVHVVYYACDHPGVVTEAVRSRAADCWDYFHEVIPRSPLVNQNLNGFNVHVDDWCGPELGDAVGQIARDISFDIAFVNYAFCSAVLEKIPAFTQKLLLTHDCFNNRNQRLLDQGLPESGWMSLTSEGERLACARADRVIALQSEEALYFEALCGGPEKIDVASPVFPLVDYIPPALNPSAPLRLGFFGSNNWINEVSLNQYLTRLCEDSELVENTRIVLAGGICNNLGMFVSEYVLERLKPQLLGRVEALSDLFEKCDLVLNPELGGTGIKIKTLETMAHGAPLLCTRSGAVGIDSPSRFHSAADIDELVSLTRDLTKDMSLLSEVRHDTKKAYSAYLQKNDHAVAALIGGKSENVAGIEPRCSWPPLVQPREIVTTPYIETHAASYHPELFKMLIDRVDLAGKRVLEIGSDYHLISARLFAANGAREVMATNIGNWKSEEPLPGNIRFQVGDVGDMDFEPGSFDVIYGIAILEHIPEFEKVVEVCKRVLAPDGVIFLQGCPIWGGSVGHHVWFEPASEDEDMRVRFAAGGSATSTNPSYRFNDDTHNPIPNWAHLVLKPAALEAHLAADGVPVSHAKGIVNYVYNQTGDFSGSCSNFFTAGTIISAFRPQFDVAVDSWQFGTEPNEYYKTALASYSHYDLDTLGLVLWMQHPEISAQEAMNAPKISVIIPFYQVEAYISECIDSVRSQDYPSLEIILVDDCGQDGSLAHAERHAHEDDRIRLVSHDINRGLGPSRNSGVAEATGDYFFFLDSDDVLQGPTVLRELMNVALSEGTQVTTGRARKLLPNGSLEPFDEVFEARAAGSGDSSYTGTDAFHACFGRQDTGLYLPMRAWGYLIEADFYRGLEIEFPAGAHEDVGVVPILCAKANAVHYTGTDIVRYRYRQDSISNTPWDQCKSGEFLQVWRHFTELLVQQGLGNEIGSAALITAQQAIWKMIANSMAQEDQEVILAELAAILADATPLHDPALVSETVVALRQMFEACGVASELRHRVEDALPLASFMAHHRHLLGLPHESVFGEDAPSFAKGGQANANAIRADGLLKQYREADADDLRDYPCMLTEADKAVYYDAGLNYEGKGLIVDGGPFVGGTTQHLIRGLKHNLRFSDGDERLKKVIKAYDLFQIDDDYILEHLQHNFPDKSFETGGSFESVFRSLTAPHESFLEVFSGDVMAAGFPFEQDIEILGVDLCKALPVTDYVVRAFFPRVIEGGLVIQQDFIHEFHPHIHLSMMLLDDYFEPDAEMRWGGSVTYRVKQRITDDVIAERFGTDTSWYQDRIKNIALLEDLIARMYYPENRFVMILTLGFYYWSLGDQDAARAAYYRAKIEAPHLEISELTKKHLRG